MRSDLAAHVPAGDDRALVADLTSAALLDDPVLRAEHGVFTAHQEEYLDGRRPTTSPSIDQQVGIGVEVVSEMTPYVVAAASVAVQIIAAAFAGAATAEAKRTIAGWIHWLLHHNEKESTTKGLPADLLERVRQTTYDVCRQMDATEEDAEVVSYAVVGRLAAASAREAAP